MSAIGSPYCPQPITFNAVWNKQNEHLRETVLERATRTVLFAINKIIANRILQALSYTPGEIVGVNNNFHEKWTSALDPSSRLLKRSFTPLPIEVNTPDGAKIRGTYFKNKAQEFSPTIICFQPNAPMSKMGVFDWLLEQAALQEFSYSFIYFDYRRCGESEKFPDSQKSLYLDGESIYQCVRDQLGIPDQNIHFLSMSLGGTISANVKAIHPECTGNYVIDRSFTSIYEVVKNMLDIRDREITVFNIVNKVLAYVAGMFLSLLNWNMESVTAIQKIKGKTLIVHHPDDELMRNGASIYRALFQRGAEAPAQATYLNLSASQSQSDFIHGAPLSDFASPSFNPEAKVAQFLFSSPNTLNQRMIQIFENASEDFREKVFATVLVREAQGRGYLWSSGEDACKSIPDDQLAEAVIATKWMA